MWTLVAPTEAASAVPSSGAGIMSSNAGLPDVALGATGIEGDAKPSDDPQAPKAPYVYSTPTITSYAVKSSAVGKLGFKLAETEVDGEAFFYVCEVAAYTHDVYISHAADDSLILNKYGIGFRIGIKAWKLGAKMSANLGTVAAAAEVQSAQTVMEILTYGDVTKYAGISKALPGLVGPFNAVTLKNIAALVAVLTDVLIIAGPTMKPLRMKYAAFKPNMYDPERVVASNSYAVNAIMRSKPRSQFDEWRTKNHGEWLNSFSSDLVHCAYESLGADQAAGAVTSEQQADADAIVRLGA